MPVLRRSLFAIAAVGAVAACSDEPTPAPTAPVTPGAPQFDVGVAARPAWIPSVCDITLLKSDARAYAKKSNDQLLGIIGDLGTEYGKSRFRNATLKAFDGLARVAAIRGTGDQKTDITPAIFNSLVEGFLACMEPAVVDNAIEPTPPPPNAGIGFGAALGSNWVFEVRGRTTNDKEPALQRTKDPAPETWWTLEPPGAATWAQAIGGTLNLDRVFVYGYQTSAVAFPGGVGSSFDHLTIPRISRDAPPKSGPDLRPYTLSVEIGLCGVEPGDSRFLNHDNVFVPLLTGIDCDLITPQQILPTSSGLAFGGSRPMMLAHQAMNLFAPKLLHAAAFRSVTGGSRDYLSPSSVYDLSLLNLGPVGTIADGRNSEPVVLFGTAIPPLPVTLKVTVVGGGNAPDGTPVTVSIVGNQSNIAFLKDGASAPATATVTRYVSGGDGVVSFENLIVTKAGGTQLGFQIEFDGFASPQIITSNTFNIQNK